MGKAIAFILFLALMIWFAHCVIKPQNVRQLQEKSIQKLHWGNTKEARELAEQQYHLDVSPETRRFKDSIVGICNDIDRQTSKPRPIPGYMQPIAGKGLSEYN